MLSHEAVFPIDTISYYVFGCWRPFSLSWAGLLQHYASSFYVAASALTAACHILPGIPPLPPPFPFWRPSPHPITPLPPLELRNKTYPYAGNINHFLLNRTKWRSPQDSPRKKKRITVAVSAPVRPAAERKRGVDLSGFHKAVETACLQKPHSTADPQTN